MSDDNIYSFPTDLKETKKEPIEILQCDECNNMTWLVSPQGQIMCAVCRDTHDMESFVDF